MAQRRPKRGHLGPQDGSPKPDRPHHVCVLAPKSPQDPPKTPPRPPQDAPKTPQDVPKRPPRDPKTPPRRAQDRPKMPPGWPILVPFCNRKVTNIIPKIDPKQKTKHISKQPHKPTIRIWVGYPLQGRGRGKPRRPQIFGLFNLES